MQEIRSSQLAIERSMSHRACVCGSLLCQLGFTEAIFDSCTCLHENIQPLGVEKSSLHPESSGLVALTSRPSSLRSCKGLQSTAKHCKALSQGSSPRSLISSCSQIIPCLDRDTVEAEFPGLRGSWVDFRTQGFLRQGDESCFWFAIG